MNNELRITNTAGKTPLSTMVLFSVIIPLVSFAQTSLTFKVVVQNILRLFNTLGIVLIALALYLFVLGVMLYIGAGGDEKKIAEGRSRMVWGILALVVLVSFWGLTAIILNTFFPGTNATGFELDDRLFNLP